MHCRRRPAVQLMGAASKKRAVQGGCPNRVSAVWRGTIAGGSNCTITLGCVLAADGVLRQLCGRRRLLLLLVSYTLALQSTPEALDA